MASYRWTQSLTLLTAVFSIMSFGSELPERKFVGCEGLLFAAMSEVFNQAGDDGPRGDVGQRIAALAAQNKSVIVNQVKQSWGDGRFTDPRKHHDERFLYLIHGVLDDQELRWRYFWGMDAPKIPSQRTIADYRSNLAKTKVIIADPPALNTIAGVSASLISELKRGTFANSGFILKPDIENVYATAPYDMGGVIRSHDCLNIRNEQLPIDRPDNILRETEYYNEIALAGDLYGNPRLEVIALFLKTDDAGIPTCSPLRHQQLQRLSRAKALPLVLIKDQQSVNLNRLY